MIKQNMSPTTIRELIDFVELPNDTGRVITNTIKKPAAKCGITTDLVMAIFYGVMGYKPQNILYVSCDGNAGGAFYLLQTLLKVAGRHPEPTTHNMGFKIPCSANTNDAHEINFVNVDWFPVPTSSTMPYSLIILDNIFVSTEKFLLGAHLGLTDQTYGKIIEVYSEQDSYHTNYVQVGVRKHDYLPKKSK